MTDRGKDAVRGRGNEQHVEDALPGVEPRSDATMPDTHTDEDTGIEGQVSHTLIESARNPSTEDEGTGIRE